MITLTGRFLQYYRENANWLERTYDFVPRVGLDEDPRVLLEDSEGIVADLDAGMQRSIDAYTDPWGQDAKEPATPASSALPAADRPPEGAGPMSLTDLPRLHDQRRRGPNAHTGGLVDVPLGEGRTFVVAAPRSRCSGCATARCTRRRRPARTPGDRSLTA